MFDSQSQRELLHGLRLWMEIEGLALVTGPSDAAGIAEATWNTQAPKRKNPGTTPGAYTIEAKGITATGYHWDGVTTITTFTIQ